MKAETSHRALVASALALIERELEGDLALDRLAARLDVSPFHFHRVFSAAVGEPPATYVRRLRLERAALRLKYTRRAVTEIAFDAGYETHEAFTRAFKAAFGVPPTGFRARELHRRDALDLDASIVRVTARRIACLRHVGPYDEIGAVFERVIAWARPRHLLARAPLLGVYWDDQTITPPQRTRCEVGLMLDQDVAVYDVDANGEIRVRTIAGGDYAVVKHRGPAHERRRSYDQLYGRWLPERGREPAAEPPFEVYSTYADGLAELDRNTSVFVPLAPERAA